MGEEKFYSPREDLEALIAAIGTLETAIGTLETSILTLSATLPIPRNEEVITGTEPSTAAYETITLIDSVLDATNNTYARRLYISVVADEDIFNYYSEEVYFVLYAAGNMRWTEAICSGLYQPAKLLAIGTIFGLQRTIQLDMIKIPANTAIKVDAITYGMPLALTLSASVAYITEES